MSELITTPFGATSTAMEVIEGINLAGKTAIITGASSGIGQETAKALASAGSEVTLAVRNTSAGSTAADEIREAVPGAKVSVLKLDLADLESVKHFANEWGSKKLDILVNNAGVMAIPERELSAQGHEMQFATNHLGHFALALGLHEALKAAGSARIVSVSSVGHINGSIDFGDIDFEHRAYDTWEAYGQSKTANILFAVEAARRWKADGISVNALNPGRISTTKLGRYLNQAASNPASNGAAATGVSVKNIEQGAATSTLLAASPLLESVTGKYFEDCNEAGPHQEGVRRGVAAYAIDADNARTLWEMSLEMVNVQAHGTRTF